MLDRVVAFTMSNSLVCFHSGLHIEQVGNQNTGNSLSVEGDPDLVVGAYFIMLYLALKRQVELTKIKHGYEAS